VFRSADARGRLAWIWTRIVGVRKRAVGAVYVTRGPGIYDWLARRGWAHLIPRRPWNLVLVTSNLARSKYVPQPLDVRVDFFRAQTEPDSRETPWEGLAERGVVLHQVVAPSIDHASMMQEPHARMLAKQLDVALQDAEAPERT
jgi:thioesterase domain-containing protein